ncbi:MAG: nucleotidyltransferase domain-containing protein [Candidatus Bathyarchaeia archaeon]
MFQIFDILKSRKAFEIIEFFIENQGEEFYQSEVSRKLRMSRNTVLKWLSVLSKKNFLNWRLSGKMKYFRLNAENVVVKQIKILMNVSKLFEVFKYTRSEGVEIYLYGSMARGEEDRESDADILIIGKIERKELIKMIEKARNTLKREVKPLVLTPLEYAELSRKDRILFENIERGKVRLL